MLSDIPEFTYYKALERMVERNKLLRLTKGIYFRGTMRTGEAEIRKEIIRYYTEAEGKLYNGVQVGGHLLEKYDLLGKTDSVYCKEECIRIYTARINEQRKKICGIELLHLPCRLDELQCRYLELLEILQHYEAAPQEMDAVELLHYIEGIAGSYKDQVMVKLLQKKPYPKHTIAFMKHLLEQQGCENGLGVFLAGTSRYRIPELAV